jgi:N-acetylmuramoyl-L-alanine amidase
MDYSEQPENNIELNCHPKIRKRRLNKRKFFIAIAMLCFMSAALIIAFHLTTGFVAVTANNEMLSVSKKASNTESPAVGHAISLSGKLIVVDAGHGGFDPGAISSSGSHEDELNLAVAKYLKSELEASDADVIMTRSDEKALAETKEEDMAERRRIITESGSDIVVSIHMNSFSDSDVSGPLVIFMQGSTQGEKLAKSIQQSMIEVLAPPMENTARSGDLYILRSGWQPCVIVECGYLSNPEEEKKLLESKYQQSVASAVCDGIKNYFASI